MTPAPPPWGRWAAAGARGRGTLWYQPPELFFGLRYPVNAYHVDTWALGPGGRPAPPPLVPSSSCLLVPLPDTRRALCLGGGCSFCSHSPVPLLPLPVLGFARRHSTVRSQLKGTIQHTGTGTGRYPLGPLSCGGPGRPPAACVFAEILTKQCLFTGAWGAPTHPPLERAHRRRPPQT